MMTDGSVGGIFTLTFILIGTGATDGGTTPDADDEEA